MEVFNNDNLIDENPFEIIESNTNEAQFETKERGQ